MELPNLSSLHGLTEIGLPHGVDDMRSALLRVLTDLYVQKLTHTPEEDRHYTELALRLLESVDAPTRVAVATRLAHHLSPPEPVMRRLAADLPEVASALLSSRALRARSTMPAKQGDLRIAASRQSIVAGSGDKPDLPGLASTPEPGDLSIAGELNEMFFAAGTHERRLILLNLHIVVPASAEQSSLGRDPTAGHRLEAAVLARRHEDLARDLSRSLLISREQARRIVGDPLGEPILVAAKVLGVARDQLHRILLFVNTAVGHSVERVHALATLYDEMRLGAALDMVGLWQNLAGTGERGALVHHSPAARERPHAHAVARRMPLPARIKRREAF